MGNCNLGRVCEARRHENIGEFHNGAQKVVTLRTTDDCCFFPIFCDNVTCRCSSEADRRRQEEQDEALARALQQSEHDAAAQQQQQPRVSYIDV